MNTSSPEIHTVNVSSPAKSPRLSRIASASLIIASFFILDKGLAFGKQILFQRVVGLDGLGIFGASNNIPDYLSALISGGALGIAFIPVLAEYLERDGRQKAWDLFSRIANPAFLVTAAISILIILVAYPLVHYVIAPGFTPANQVLTASLMRLDLIAILVFSISGLVMASLQANQHFLLPAMAPVLYNVGQIFGVLVLSPQQGLHIGPITLPAFGLGLYGMVYGVILGALLHLLIQVPGLIRFQYHWRPVLGLRDPGVVRVLSLMGPRVLTMACLQMYFLSRDNFSSHFGAAGVGALNLGWTIEQVPETVIGTAIAIAMLPSLAEHISRGETGRFRETVNRALKVMMALCLPVAVVLAFGVQPLAQRLFNFGPEELAIFMGCTLAFLLGLLGDTWLEVAVRSFYARQNTRTPLITAFFQAITFICLAFLLSRAIGLAGVALAAALTFTSEALLLLFLLNRSVPGILNLGSTLLRSVLAAAAAALVAFLIMRFLPLPSVILSIGSMALGCLAALPLIWPEVKSLVRL